MSYSKITALSALNGVNVRYSKKESVDLSKAWNAPRSSLGHLKMSLLATACSLAAGYISNAVGQEEERVSEAASTMEEIIVYARRREELLQETPISITAFTHEMLDARSFTNLRQVGQATPNMRFVSQGTSSGRGSEALLFIRGIGQTDAWMTQDPAVGIYIDGVYLARAAGSVLDLLDVERVEVLRGPQGTLFGRNTIGGALLVSTSPPKQDREGTVRLTVGDYDRTDIEASVHLPLSDNVYSKLAVSDRSRDGYIDEVFTGEDGGEEDRQAARAGLSWFVNPKLTVSLSADYTRIRERPTPYAVVEANPAAPLAGLWNALVGPTWPNPATGMPGIAFDDTWVTDDETKSFATDFAKEELDAWGTSLVVDWELPWDITMKSITAYRDIDSDFANDHDGTPVPFEASGVQPERQDQFSQEFQFNGKAFDNRLDWVAGLYYFEEDTDLDAFQEVASGLFDALEAFPGPFIPLAPGVTCPPPPGVFLPCAGGAGNPFNIALDIRFDFVQELNNTSYAPYLHGKYDITGDLAVSAGVRYSYEDKDFYVNQVHPTGLVQVNGDESDDWSAWTPKFGVEYQLFGEHLLYLSAARGFKSGGWNGRPTQSTIQTYDEEFVWSYELGLKADLVENRLRINTALFFNDYEDIQLVSAQSDPQTGQLVFVTENAGDADIQGFEVELTAIPLDGLQITAGVGYTDVDYTDLAPNCATVQPGESCTKVEKGMTLPQTPEWTFNSTLQYTFPPIYDGELTFQADYYYTDEYFTDPFNVEAISQDSYSKVNARLAYLDRTGRWELAVFGTNLTDEMTIANGYEVEAFGVRAVSYQRPREWGVSFQLNL